MSEEFFGAILQGQQAQRPQDVQLFGTAITTAGQVAQGIGAFAEFELQADIAKDNAAIALEETILQERTLRRRQRQRRGAIRARIGASGVDIEGSPLEVLASQAADDEQAALGLRFAGLTRRQEQKFRQRIFRRRGRAEAGGAVVGVGRTLLTGIRKFRQAGGFETREVGSAQIR